MSKGDNLIGIPTKYKDIEMRSKLEAKIAFFLDGLKIKWTYEPKTFLLSMGIVYKPDFYLPELKMWVEVKGVIEEHNKSILECFVKDNKTELILISSKDMIWFSSKDFVDGIGIDKDLYIGECSICKHFFFCSNLGSYHCRNCGACEGDHDLRFNFTGWQNEDIDFSNLDSIKDFLERNKIHATTN